MKSFELDRELRKSFKTPLKKYIHQENGRRSAFIVYCIYVFIGRFCIFCHNMKALFEL